MSAPDGPPDEIAAAITALVETVAERLQSIVNVTWAKGMRDGMEVGAMICDGMAAPLATSYCEIASAAVQAARDAIRIAALDVETPK